MKKGTQTSVSRLPKCDFCGDEARYDGKTTMGPWGYMCHSHFIRFGSGLGTGLGQQLMLEEESVPVSAQSLTYEGWLDEVDRQLTKMTGFPMSHLDFGDFASRDLYDAGEAPEPTAREILENELGYGEME